MSMRIVALLKVITHLAGAVWKLAIEALRWTDHQRAAEITCWAQRVFALFGVRLVVRGATPRQPGALFAGNHVSWLDIFALLATTDLRFVAKAEVRHWPVIGWLAARVGTQFIARDRRADAHVTAQAMTDLMRGGTSVCIFPEGTTTSGHALRPFRAPLFEPAAQGRAHVQPFAIRYLSADGRASDAAAFTGEMTLGRAIWSLLSRRDLTCEIVFLDVIATHGLSRRQLALMTERSVRAALGVGVLLREEPAGEAPAHAPVLGIAEAVPV